MEDLYLRYLDGLAPYVSLFNHYAHCGAPRSSGNWGARIHTGQPLDEAPKARALAQWAAAQPSRLRERALSSPR
ncbi:hypothetical protein [Streptomyces sp. NPDC001661]